MPKYAVFFTFTGQTIKGLVDKPSDRAAAVRALCESAGGSLESYYLMMGGEYDGFAVCDVPDTRTAASLSVAVSSSGAFHHLATHELIDAADLGGILQAAGELAYQPPGT
jgi:uncharacterized protein with GYD domain